MVEYSLNLDLVFQSLADPTRRDILQQLLDRSLTISEIARKYDLTFAAVSKHLKVLENAHLVIKKRRGKERVVTAAPEALQETAEYLRRFEKLWDERFNKLDVLLKEK